MITWNELIVTDAEGMTVGTLGEVVDNMPANLDNAVIEDGKITAWEGFFLSAEGEQPDWNTPAVPVDWEGFESRRAAVCGW